MRGSDAKGFRVFEDVFSTTENFHIQKECQRLRCMRRPPRQCSSGGKEPVAAEGEKGEDGIWDNGVNKWLKTVTFRTGLAENG